MDQVKIGKLIAMLRKDKGLTQRELGEMVGVGFRAVSKWENGLTCPDISIINELSQILGISTDELLKGEVNKTQQPEIKKKHNYKNIIYTIPIILVIILSIVLVIINNNKTEVYELFPTDDTKYYVEGEIIFKGNETTININKLSFEDSLFKETIIKNYQYELISNDKLIIGEGYIPKVELLAFPKSIKEYSNDFKINYINNNQIKKEKIINDGLNLKFIFLDETNKEIKKDIKISLIKSK